MSADPEGSTFEVREEEEGFRFWSCVSCRRPLFDDARGSSKDLEESMDLKLKLCCEKRIAAEAKESTERK